MKTSWMNGRRYHGTNLGLQLLILAGALGGSGALWAAPVTTTGFLNLPRAEVPGTLLSHPVTNGSVTLGRTTTLNYVNGWLIVGGEGPGSAAPYDLIKRVYSVEDPANPVRVLPSDFELDYPGNRWVLNTDGWNGHGSAQSGSYLLPLVMRVSGFGGVVELGGEAGIPNMGELPLGYNRSSQAGPWEATMLWYGSPAQQMEIRRAYVGPAGATQFQVLATFDHVGTFGGGDWHPMFFGDLLIYARSGGCRGRAGGGGSQAGDPGVFECLVPGVPGPVRIHPQPEDQHDPVPRRPGHQRHRVDAG
jgi:hypothetical protein